jgi:hypothetical protein
MATSVRRFFSNIISGLIADKDKRKKVRVILNSDIVSYLRFIRRDVGSIHKIKTFTGYQARSLLISVNDEYIYKFPLQRTDSNELALRERDIVSALAPISPIYIPPVEILKYKKVLVRKYRFINGVQLRKMPLDTALGLVEKIAPVIANFLYMIGRADPAEIAKYKPSPDMQCGYMFGWTQGDIADNFLVDEKTHEIIAFIDWEDAVFGDFCPMFKNEKRSPSRELMAAVQIEYDKLYKGKK